MERGVLLGSLGVCTSRKGREWAVPTECGSASRMWCHHDSDSCFITVLSVKLIFLIHNKCHLIIFKQFSVVYFFSREKMAFFLKSSPTIPPLTMDSDSDLASPSEPLSPLQPTAATTLPLCSSATSDNKNPTHSSQCITRLQYPSSDQKSDEHTPTQTPHTSSPSSPTSTSDTISPPPTSTTTLSSSPGSASLVVRQLTARQSTTGAIPKVFRPDVLFSTEDQGVEVWSFFCKLGDHSVVLYTICSWLSLSSATRLTIIYLGDPELKLRQVQGTLLF